jgi:hypothetical protein
MVCFIHVTGQISGNFTLARAIDCFNVKKGNYNSFLMFFDSIKEAKKALKDAFYYLKSEELDFYKNGGIRKDKNNNWLHYDASKAEINKLNK